MAWNDELVPVLRNMIDDNDPNKIIYNDRRLEELILSSAQLLISRARFNNEYKVSVADCMITPDPTSKDYADQNFVNLLLMQAACIVLKCEAREAARRTVSLKHDNTSIDTRARTEARFEILRDKNNWCEIFNKCLTEYKLNRISIVGESILGPFRSDYHPF